MNSYLNPISLGYFCQAHCEHIFSNEFDIFLNIFSYSQRDEDVIRHCFRYTVPVLTSVLALQKETRLKQETQVRTRGMMNSRLGKHRPIPWENIEGPD